MPDPVILMPDFDRPLAYLVWTTPLLALVLSAGCFASHGLGGEPPPRGDRCGPVTCEVGQECCNESCGICAWPGEGCIGLFCLDAGAPRDAGSGSVCGDERCAAGITCCFGCDGPYCGGGDGLCPDLVCPPESCFGSEDCGGDEYCRFQEGSCGRDGECTARPTACTDDCPGVCACDGETYCNECEAASAGQNVVSRRACEWEPPMGPCDFLSYCECTEQPGCEPLIDLRMGCICTCDDPFNCTGIDCDCDCGGADFIRCAPEGLCDETEVNCTDDEVLTVDSTGCPRCTADP